MWSKLIDALLELLKSRLSARTRLSKALSELHTRMSQCHESFVAFRSHEGYDYYRNPYNRPGMRKDWYEKLRRLEENHRSAIENLIRSVWKLRDILPIFSPETMQHLNAYIENEVMSYWHPH